MGEKVDFSLGNYQEMGEEWSKVLRNGKVLPKFCQKSLKKSVMKGKHGEISGKVQAGNS